MNLKKLKALTLVVIACALTRMAFAADTGKTAGETPDAPAASLLRIIDALVSSKPPLTPGAITKATSMPLSFRRSPMNDHFDLLETSGAARSGIKRIELRAPHNPSMGDFVTLDISPDVIVSPQDIMKQYGKNMNVTISAHGNPKNARSYYTYPIAGGELTFEITRRQPRRLTGVVINRAGAGRK